MNLTTMLYIKVPRYYHSYTMVLPQYFFPRCMYKIPWWYYGTLPFLARERTDVGHQVHFQWMWSSITLNDFAFAYTIKVIHCLQHILWIMQDMNEKKHWGILFLTTTRIENARYFPLSVQKNKNPMREKKRTPKWTKNKRKAAGLYSLCIFIKIQRGK